MSLTYTEELVFEYFKHLVDESGNFKYVVTFRIPFQLPERSEKKIKGWSDIDVLAIGNKEICIVQTKSFTGTKKKELVIKDIKNFFKYSEDYVKKQKYFMDKKLRNILVVDDLSKPMTEAFKKEGIEVLRLEYVTKELIKVLKKRIVNKKRVGKEESNVTRTLLVLIHYDLFKEKVYE